MYTTVQGRAEYSSIELLEFEIGLELL